MSIIKMQQSVADQVLEKISEIDKYARICGGAPRDWYLGQEANDLDVYFHPNPNWDTITTYQKLQEIGFSLDGYKDFGEDGIFYGKMKQLKAIFEPTDTSIKVQLIMISEPVQLCVLQSFALDLSLVTYKYGKVVATTEFVNAVITKTISRIHPDYSDYDPYIMKILNKFPDYKYVGAHKMPIGIPF